MSWVSVLLIVSRLRSLTVVPACRRRCGFASWDTGPGLRIVAHGNSGYTDTVEGGGHYVCA